jgi:hypothetical protein
MTIKDMHPKIIMIGAILSIAWVIRWEITTPTTEKMGLGDIVEFAVPLVIMLVSLLFALTMTAFDALEAQKVEKLRVLSLPKEDQQKILKQKHENNKKLVIIVFILLGLWIVYEMLMNFARKTA